MKKLLFLLFIPFLGFSQLGFEIKTNPIIPNLNLNSDASKGVFYGGGFFYNLNANSGINLDLILGETEFVETLNDQDFQLDNFKNSDVKIASLNYNFYPNSNNKTGFVFSYSAGLYVKHDITNEQREFVLEDVPIFDGTNLVTADAIMSQTYDIENIELGVNIGASLEYWLTSFIGLVGEVKLPVGLSMIIEGEITESQLGPVPSEPIKLSGTEFLVSGPWLSCGIMLKIFNQ